MKTPAMNRLLPLTAFVVSLLTQPAAAQKPVFVGGSVPQMVLSKGAGEGPAWHPRTGLLMSYGGHIYQLKNGQPVIFRKNAGTNGLLFDHQGNLLACEPRYRQVTRMTAAGKIEVLTAK